MNSRALWFELYVHFLKSGDDAMIARNKATAAVIQAELQWPIGGE